MEITLDELLDGKSTSIKNKEYLSTREYIDPFLDEMSKFTDHFIARVQMPTQLTSTNGVPDLTYNRVWLQAVLPESHCIDNHDEVYGIVYGLDVRNPIYKIYRGMLNRACTNLTVFNPSWQQTYELQPNSNFTYNIKELMESVSNFETTIKKMKSTYLPSDVTNKHTKLGEWVEKAVIEEFTNIGGKVKLSPTTVIKAYESVYYDTSSQYYVGNNESTVFNFYNAFTDIITNDKKDIMNKFEKTIIINSLFNL